MRRAVEPSSRLGWWAFWLSFATVVWGRLYLALPARLGPLLEGQALQITLALAGVALEVLLLLAALVAGAVALRKGERSRMVLVALATAVLVGGFWTVVALGPGRVGWRSERKARRRVLLRA